MSSLSPYEIAGLAALVVVAAWLALGSPGSMSVFNAILSPFEFVLSLGKEASRISKDMTYSWLARALATVAVKLGWWLVLLLLAAVVALVAFGRFARFFPRFRIF